MTDFKLALARSQKALRSLKRFLLSSCWREVNSERNGGKLPSWAELSYLFWPDNEMVSASWYLLAGAEHPSRTGAPIRGENRVRLAEVPPGSLGI